MVNCSPELGAAAMVIVKLGSESYREGKVFHFDRETMTVSDGNPSWAKQWEQLSGEGGPRGKCRTGKVDRPEASCILRNTNSLRGRGSMASTHRPEPRPVERAGTRASAGLES